MIERADGDVTNISNFFAMFIVQVIGSFVLLAGILGFMFTVNLPIAIVMTVFTLLSILFMVFIRIWASILRRMNVKPALRCSGN